MLLLCVSPGLRGVGEYCDVYQTDDPPRAEMTRNLWLQSRLDAMNVSEKKVATSSSLKKRDVGKYC